MISYTIIFVVWLFLWMALGIPLTMKFWKKLLVIYSAAFTNHNLLFTNLNNIAAALKSILTTKDLARFTTKPQSLKEKQLQDICRIVTGILVYNKNYCKQDDAGECKKLKWATWLQKGSKNTTDNLSQMI